VTPDQWIERYRRALERADADEVVDLFGADASYRSSVFRGSYLGRDALRRYRQRGAGTQWEVAVRMDRPIIADDRVAVEWWTTMIDPMRARSPCRVACSCAFAPDGRWQDLWEDWQVKPAGRTRPPAGGPSASLPLTPQRCRIGASRCLGAPGTLINLDA
jgi:hypothetical protein